jgi:hypothetical protein
MLSGQETVTAQRALHQARARVVLGSLQVLSVFLLPTMTGARKPPRLCAMFHMPQ